MRPQHAESRPRGRPGADPEGRSRGRIIGRPVPSHDVIGIEKVTGITPQPSDAAQMLRSEPATAVAPAPAMAMVSQRVATLFDEYYRNVVALMGGWQREAEPGARTLLYDTAARVYRITD